MSATAHLYGWFGIYCRRLEQLHAGVRWAAIVNVLSSDHARLVARYAAV
jgi:hypothetical protein